MSNFTEAIDDQALMGSLPENFHEIQLLTPAECQRVRASLQMVQPHWQQRGPLPFFTMGVASYLDHALGRGMMVRRAGEVNPILREHFQWLYDRLLEGLQVFLNEPALLDSEFAVPGFHIFHGHEAFTQPIASMHFDLQHDHYDWSPRYQKTDLSATLSMTLPICLPAAGSGLRIWDLTWERAQTLSAEEFSRFKQTASFTYHPYALGKVVIHSGHYLHQIAPLAEVHPGDERVTLQAHCVRTERGWVVYW